MWKQMFLTETLDGGNGKHSAIVINFNAKEFASYKVNYSFNNRKVIIDNLIELGFNKSQISKIKEIYISMSQEGPWNLYVDCFSPTIEQRTIFYIKESDHITYYCELKNLDFTLNPVLRIDKDLLELVRLIESAKYILKN